VDLDELKSNIVEVLNLNFEEEGRMVREEDFRIVLDDDISHEDE
jgi:hypothetical protein